MNHPVSNKLPDGLTESDVLEAVIASDYPLQTLVASSLYANFDRVQEQWSYADSNTGELRTLNILATKYPDGPDEDIPRGDIAAGLTLLVECRRSSLPYVFFLALGQPEIPDFPLITGLPPLKLWRDDGAYWPNVSLPRALSLDSADFVKQSPYCSSFTSCYMEGDHLRVADSEPFNELARPLTDAMRHYEALEAHRGEASYLSHLVVGLVVLDAPMVSVQISESGSETSMTPWVRVARHETIEVRDFRRGGKLFAIDVIHKDYLQTYLNDHLFPFTETFSQLLEKYRNTLVSGEGPAAGMDKRLA